MTLLIGMGLFLAVMIPIGWFGIRRRRREEAEDDADLSELSRGADAPQIDEKWEQQEFGEGGRR